MTILVYGARGWLGRQYVAHWRQQGHTVMEGTADIRWEQDGGLSAEFARTTPDVVLNAAAKTSSPTMPSIAACEVSHHARSEAYEVNAMGAWNIARLCLSHGARLVHLSTGYVFSGPGPFAEDDRPCPSTWYGWTKLQGEGEVMDALPSALMLRLQLPISGTPHPRNLITKLAAYAQVADVTASVTVVEDLLTWTDDLLASAATGLVHTVSPTPVAFRDLLAWYRELVDPAFQPAWTTAVPPSPILTSTRLQDRQSTEQAIRRCLRAYAQHLVGVA